MGEVQQPEHRQGIAAALMGRVDLDLGNVEAIAQRIDAIPDRADRLTVAHDRCEGHGGREQKRVSVALGAINLQVNDGKSVAQSTRLPWLEKIPNRVKGLHPICCL